MLLLGRILGVPFFLCAERIYVIVMRRTHVVFSCHRGTKRICDAGYFAAGTDMRG